MLTFYSGNVEVASNIPLKSPINFLMKLLTKNKINENEPTWYDTFLKTNS